jgi:ribose transport system substrate-binding protein
MRRKSIRGPLAVTAALLLAVLTACSQTSEPNAGDDPTDTATSEATAEETEDSGDDTEWFDQAVFDEQDEQRGATFEGDP